MISVSYSKLKPTPQDVADPNTALQAIWNNLPDEAIC